MQDERVEVLRLALALSEQARATAERERDEALSQVAACVIMLEIARDKMTNVWHSKPRRGMEEECAMIAVTLANLPAIALAQSKVVSAAKIWERAYYKNETDHSDDTEEEMIEPEMNLSETIRALLAAEKGPA